MKTFLRALLAVVIVSLSITTVALAQAATYDRPTVNFMLLTYGDSYDASSTNIFNTFQKEDKFYYNNLPKNVLRVPKMKRSNSSTTAWQSILAELNRQDIAKKEISLWYSRQDNGLMSMQLIHSRGEFSATDEAYLTAHATKRGSDELRDFGNKLISKTYIVVVDYSNITYTLSDNQHVWKSAVRAFVFKLKYNDEIENQIYDTWIDEGDSPEVIAEKQKRFDQIPFEMEYVMQVSHNASTGRLSSALLSVSSTNVSKESVLNQMYKSGYTKVLNQLEKSVAAFKVVAGVWQVDPIRAKIGKKEGLKTDQRYFVLEYEQNEKGKLKAKRKAVIRAGGRVADNRTVATGKSQASTFYQVAGGGIQPGMTLEQKNDLGWGLMAGYFPEIQSDGKPSQAGAKLRLEMLTNRMLNFGIWPGLYIYGEGEFESTKYTLNSDFNSLAEEDSYSFTRAGLGLGKNFHFLRNFALSPYLGVGWEFSTAEGDAHGELDFEAIYFKAGVNLVVNIYYPVQLVGGVSGFGYGSLSVSDHDDLSYKYKDVFKGRSSGGFSGFVGVRINF